MTDNIEQVRLVKSYTSSSGYDLYVSEKEYVPASYYQVVLWKMLEEAREEIRLLKEIIDAPTTNSG